VRLLFRAFRIGRPHPARPIRANLCVALATAADLGLLGILKRFVDQSLVGPFPPRLAVLTVGAGILRESASYLGGLLSMQASTKLAASLQNNLYAHLHRLPFECFHKNHPGESMSRLFQDVDLVVHVVTGGFVMAIEAAVRLLGLFAALFYLDHFLALIVPLVVVPGALLARVLARKLRLHLRRLSDELAGFYRAAYESLGAAEIARPFGRERKESLDALVRKTALGCHPDRSQRDSLQVAVVGVPFEAEPPLPEGEDVVVVAPLGVDLAGGHRVLDVREPARCSAEADVAGHGDDLDRVRSLPRAVFLESQ